VNGRVADPGSVDGVGVHGRVGGHGQSVVWAAMDHAPTPEPPVTEQAAAAAPATPLAAPLDLDGIERDLADVEVALARLDAGTYWTDEVTGAELPAELLAAQPTARRADH